MQPISRNISIQGLKNSNNTKHMHKNMKMNGSNHSMSTMKNKKSMQAGCSKKGMGESKSVASISDEKLKNKIANNDLGSKIDTLA